MKKTLAALAAAAVMGVGAGALTAAPAQAAGDPCGYYHSKTTLYYNHCGSGKVLVDIKDTWGSVVETRCLPPGETAIGAYGNHYHSARSDGEGCGGGSGSW